MANEADWEHLKQYGYAPGNYMSKCYTCDKSVEFLDKRAITCRPCAEARHAEAIATQSPASPQPEAAEPVAKHLAIALDMLDYLSGYPDFTAPEGEVTATAIADAIAGKFPKLLTDIGYLAQGLRPAATPQTPQRQEAAQVEAWRPIETAPQHGTILLWWRNAGACTGGFAVDEEWTPKSKTPREGWRGDGDEGIPRNQEDCTHWQLLRAPLGHRWPRFSDGHSTQEWFEEHYATPPEASRVAVPQPADVDALMGLVEKLVAAELGCEEGNISAAYRDAAREELRRALKAAVPSAT